MAKIIYLGIKKNGFFLFCSRLFISLHAQDLITIKTT